MKLLAYTLGKKIPFKRFIICGMSLEYMNNIELIHYQLIQYDIEFNLFIISEWHELIKSSKILMRVYVYVSV